MSISGNEEKCDSRPKAKTLEIQTSLMFTREADTMRADSMAE